MLEFFQRLFDADFMAHRFCIREPVLIRIHAISDLLIALAYYTIPIALVYFVRKRRDIAFSYVFLWFGAFIFACGTTHLLGMIVLWTPMYRLDALVKLFTAVVSLYTGFLLWPLMPRILALPSPAQLAEANRKLGEEIGERIEAENAVRKLNAELEDRVRLRTAELTRSNRELQERTAEMEQFTYTVSHDLKSPLVTVQGFAGLLEQEITAGRTDRLAEFAHEIKAAGQHMSQLIGDLLELSRIGRIVNRIEEVAIGDVVQAILDEQHIEIENRGIRVECETPLPTLLVDGGRIRQVLDNLIVNAIKYGADNPSPRISVGSVIRDGQVQIYVRDNGTGIPENYHRKIFDLFQRLHVDQEGTGVGLAIVKRIVELHNGRVWLESKLGNGAAFWIAFPLSMNVEKS